MLLALVGAAAVGLVGIVNRSAGWQTSLLVLPLIYWVYRSYRLYLGRLEAEKERVEIEKRHVEQIASLNMRTIEALALAIEAKDHTTGDHLQRVRIYALELAKDLNLTPAETSALRAAAVLHDIGKLAVPEHIISKPGKLTPEEFEKMKVHPIVGAEILDQVRFPYPVGPIVRSHHEKWDGSGYPDGLAGEEIPIAARILHAARDASAFAAVGGAEMVVSMAERAAGSQNFSALLPELPPVAAASGNSMKASRLICSNLAALRRSTKPSGFQRCVRSEPGENTYTSWPSISARYPAVARKISPFRSRTTSEPR